MSEFESLDDTTSDTVFRDLILLTLAGFITVTFILLPHISPKAKAESDVASPGNLIVELRWSDRLDADVDLWVEAPSDKPVGYSNQSAKVFNLLRDDIGKANDISEINYEVAYSRGLPKGEYVVNLHFFSNRSKSVPIEAQVIVSVKKNSSVSARRLLTKRINLRRLGEEITVFRFKLDDKGVIDRKSVTDLPRALRSRGMS